MMGEVYRWACGGDAGHLRMSFHYLTPLGVTAYIDQVKNSFKALDYYYS